MKKRVVNFALVLVLSILCLSGCVGPNTVRVHFDEVKNSLKNDYNIFIEEEYGIFNLWGKNIEEYSYLLDSKEIKEKLDKWTDSLSVLYIRTNHDEHKFIYYPSEIAKKSIKENGKTIVAETKDYIYVSDFPFNYTYSDIYERCVAIDDGNVKDEILSAFENRFGDDIYLHIYPANKKVAFRSLNNEEATLINSYLVDKELVFTISAIYESKSYYYYFFYIEENGTYELYIYKEAWMNPVENSKIVYTSSTTAPATPMTKDMFINHLKTL